MSLRNLVEYMFMTLLNLVPFSVLISVHPGNYKAAMEFTYDARSCMNYMVTINDPCNIQDGRILKIDLKIPNHKP